MADNHANLATAHWGDHFDMYATDRSPQDDAKLIRRVEVAQPAEAPRCRAHRRDACSHSGSQVPAIHLHARRGRSLSEDYHKSPRSLPVSAPGIPSSARDHSLSPGSPHALSFLGRDPRTAEIVQCKFRRFGTVPQRVAWADFIRRRKHQVFTTPQLSSGKSLNINGNNQSIQMRDS